MVNTILFGQYEIESTIGAGGMAVVYKARHLTLGQHFAIKKLSDSLSQNSDARERFIREAKTHSKLDHPNIVKFHDILKDPTTQNVFIVMEYVEGRTLSQMIGKETGPIPFDRAYPIFKQVLDGIGYAHSLGVVHRDIKPSNIIITSSGRIKILDFGIARDETGQTLTQSGTVIGTLQYASPEQIKGERVDQRSDIYSLGMTLYEMLSGRLPLEINTSTSSYHVMQRVLNEPVPDPRSFYPHIDERIVSAIFMAIERDHGKRIASVADFVAVLEGTKSVSGIPSNTGQKTGQADVFERAYRDLTMLQRMNQNFFVSRKDNGDIEIKNRADGYKGMRISFLLVGVLFAVFFASGLYEFISTGGRDTDLISPMLIIGGIAANFIWLYFSLIFQNGDIILTKNEIKVYNKTLSGEGANKYSEIVNLYYHSSKRSIIMQRKGINIQLFRNSKKEVLQRLSMILRDVWAFRKQI
ncbi:MAG: serine/threonine protein kinase [Bacteroidetes bacterium]|nr:serine/threonine protein kinase [Bacteroidota bacterium]